MGHSRLGKLLSSLECFFESSDDLARFSNGPSIDCSASWRKDAAVSALDIMVSGGATLEMPRGNVKCATQND